MFWVCNNCDSWNGDIFILTFLHGLNVPSSDQEYFSSVYDIAIITAEPSIIDVAQRLPTVGPLLHVISESSWIVVDVQCVELVVECLLRLSELPVGEPPSIESIDTYKEPAGVDSVAHSSLSNVQNIKQSSDRDADGAVGGNNKPLSWPSSSSLTKDELLAIGMEVKSFAYTHLLSMMRVDGYRAWPIGCSHESAIRQQRMRIRKLEQSVLQKEVGEEKQDVSGKKRMVKEMNGNEIENRGKRRRKDIEKEAHQVSRDKKEGLAERIALPLQKAAAKKEKSKKSDGENSETKRKESKQPVRDVDERERGSRVKNPLTNCRFGEVVSYHTLHT